jgi:serine/threonine protein kinase
MNKNPFRFKIGQLIRSNEASYEIIEQKAAGYHGCSYLAICKSGPIEGQKVFVKTPNVDLNIPDIELPNRSSKIYATFMAEFANRDRLKNIPGVAEILDFGFHTEQNLAFQMPVIVPFLVQTFINGSPLETYLKTKYGQESYGVFHGIHHQKDWFLLVGKLLEILRRIHNRHVVHGDIWPPNVLMVGDEPYLVDFGQSFLVDFAMHQVGGAIRPHPYLAPERRKQGKFWYSPADIYSMGGLLFYLACGQTPPEPETDTEKLKNTILHTIYEHNPNLLQENQGIVKIIDKCLRHSVEERYSYPESIVAALEIFDYKSPQSDEVIIEKNKELVLEIGRAVTQLGVNQNSLFNKLLSFDLQLLRKEIEAMKANHHEILGDREEIINSLLRYLSVLENGDEYLTVTSPQFWMPDNLGVNGRFLTLNVMMAQRGVQIKRVFLLTESDRINPETLKILNAHLNAMKELPKDVTIATKEPVGASEKIFYTGFVLVTDEYRQEVVDSGCNVAIWKRKSGEMMSITFNIRPGSNQIGKVRFSSSPAQLKFLAEFQSRINEAKPLAEFFTTVP